MSQFVGFFLLSVTVLQLDFNAAEQEDEIDAFIQRTMDCYGIPGFSMAVLNDGQDFMAKGYGVRDLETQEPVTNETLTLINSNTKAFAGVSAAIVIKNNSAGFDWDTPVREVIGDWFYLNDSLRTSHVTMRDLLAHRVGLHGYSNYYLSGLTGDEAIRRMQYVPLDKGFRDVFDYNNLMYALAGYVIGKVTDSRWEAVAISNIFEPLGMDDTTFVWDESQWEKMMSGYYVTSDGSPRQVDLDMIKKGLPDSMTAAAGILSNALDMRKWMQFQLNEGKTPDGEEILTTDEFQVTHEPTNHMEGEPLYQPPQNPVLLPVGSYSIGWTETSYRDYLISQHAGVGSGYRSLITILKSMGIAIFTGSNVVPDYSAHDDIHLYILDQLLGYDPWLANQTCPILLASSNCMDKAAITAMDDGIAGKVMNWQHLNDAKNAEVGQYENVNRQEFVGIYGHHGLGNLTVYQNETTGGLFVQGGMDIALWELEPSAEDNTTFLARGVDPIWMSEGVMTFDMDETGSAIALFVTAAEGHTDRFDRDLDWNDPPLPPELC